MAHYATGGWQTQGGYGYSENLYHPEYQLKPTPKPSPAPKPKPTPNPPVNAYENTKNLSPDAILSDAAYRGAAVKGYKIDTQLSSPDRTVYYDPDTNKATIAFRGTDVHHKNNFWRDLGADVSIFFGAEKLNHRFKNAEKVTRAAIEKYGKDNVRVTGHSLGGSEGMYVSNKLGVEAVVFNPGVGPGDLIRETFHKSNYSNVTENLVLGDPVATLSVRETGFKKKNIQYKPIGKLVAKQGWNALKGTAELALIEAGIPEAAPLINAGRKVGKFRTGVSIAKDIGSLHGLQHFTANSVQARNTNAHHESVGWL